MTAAYPPDPFVTTGRFDIDRSDLSYRIYEALKRQILCGQLAPGTRLSLDELAQSFRVSVTPVRDAVRLLSADGLVDLRQRRGAFVMQPTPLAICETFQIRELLECGVVDHILTGGEPALATLEQILEEMAGTTVGEGHRDYIAYIRLDQRFHQSLIDCLCNHKLSEFFAGLGAFTLTTLILAHETDHRGSATLDEHRAIVDALRRGDVAAARSAVSAHLRNACADLLARLAEHHAM